MCVCVCVCVCECVCVCVCVCVRAETTQAETSHGRNYSAIFKGRSDSGRNVDWFPVPVFIRLRKKRPVEPSGQTKSRWKTSACCNITESESKFDSLWLHCK